MRFPYNRALYGFRWQDFGRTLCCMSVYIAIPEPTSCDSEYNLRSLHLYLSALHSSGAVPVVVPLHERQDRVAKLLTQVQGVLLPGSRFDLDPQRYGEDRSEACSEGDPARTAVDELLLQDAFSLYKPVLGICQGLQSLNVWRNGSLIQDLQTEVNHRPGREVMEAHRVQIAPHSRLSGMLDGVQSEVMVNSSHHQAVKEVGDRLNVSAFSPLDGVVEALELESEDHFVLGVQWHPERSYLKSEFSRRIFSAFVAAAAAWRPREVRESVVPA
jgi:putative glutamine amidotransferase